MKWYANSTQHISRGEKLSIYTARLGDKLGQTCLNLTFRLIQCWTFFVELGFKRIYIMRSIYKDFKKCTKALQTWNNFKRMLI